jgi:hypothetical protein
VVLVQTVGGMVTVVGGALVSIALRGEPQLDIETDG